MKTDVNMDKEAFDVIRRMLSIELLSTLREKSKAERMKNETSIQICTAMASALKDTIAFVEMRKGVV